MLRHRQLWARVFKYLKLKQGTLYIHRTSVLQEYFTKFSRALETTVILNYIYDLTPDDE